MKIETAVIIAGGEGQRLWPHTEKMPKTLAQVAGKPILQWKIEWLKAHGITHLVLGVAFKKEMIFDFMKANDNFGLKVDFSEHSVSGGTAEAIRLAITRFVNDENYLVMNGDDILVFNIEDMIEVHKRNGALMTMGLAHLYCRNSIVVTEGEAITDYKYGGKIPSILLSNGIYVFNKKMQENLVEKGSMEDLVFAKLAKQKKMAHYTLKDGEFWFPINTVRELQEAEKAKDEWVALHEEHLKRKR